MDCRPQEREANFVGQGWKNVIWFGETRVYPSVDLIEMNFPYAKADSPDMTLLKPQTDCLSHEITTRTPLLDWEGGGLEYEHRMTDREWVVSAKGVTIHNQPNSSCTPRSASLQAGPNFVANPFLSKWPAAAAAERTRTDGLRA